VRLEEIFNFSLCHTSIIQFRAGKCKAKEPFFSKSIQKSYPILVVALSHTLSPELLVRWAISVSYLW
jgi:hypothetical protein